VAWLVRQDWREQPLPPLNLCGGVMRADHDLAGAGEAERSSAASRKFGGGGSARVGHIE